MAAIYEEVVLSWKGEEYTVRPNFQLVQKIESRGISIAGVVGQITRGEPPLSQMAVIFAHMLRSGGADATPDEVYDLLAGILKRGVAVEWELITTAITLAFFPQEPEGNSEGPGNGAAPPLTLIRRPSAPEE